MAEPTLKDVLAAITEIRAEMATKSELAKVDAKVDIVTARLDRVESKVETVSSKVDAHRAETGALRAETKQGFADVDKNLAHHAVVSHRDLEERVDKLEKRLPVPRRAASAPRRR